MYAAHLRGCGRIQEFTSGGVGKNQAEAPSMVSTEGARIEKRRRRRVGGVWGGVSPLPSRLRVLRSVNCELPQRGPAAEPRPQSHFGIFYGRRTLLVEKM